jgi:hypothetical protein
MIRKNTRAENIKNSMTSLEQNYLRAHRAWIRLGNVINNLNYQGNCKIEPPMLGEMSARPAWAEAQTLGHLADVIEDALSSFND